MKKLMFVALLGATLAGCSEYSESDRTVGGALIGAGTGAAIGAIATGDGTGAAIGALAGGATGAVVGNATTPRACRVYDAYGYPHRVRCP